MGVIHQSFALTGRLNQFGLSLRVYNDPNVRVQIYCRVNIYTVHPHIYNGCVCMELLASFMDYSKVECLFENIDRIIDGLKKKRGRRVWVRCDCGSG